MEIEKPECCRICDYWQEQDNICLKTGRFLDRPGETCPPSWCPLPDSVQPEDSTDKKPWKPKKLAKHIKETGDKVSLVSNG